MAYQRMLSVGVVVALATVLVSTPVAASAGSGKGPEQGTTSGRTVGNAHLHRCAVTGRSWCGSLQVPLDYADATAGTITVGFAWFPAAGRPDGTIVAMEGGPGYPSTGTAPDFLTLFGRCCAQRNLLVVDARGTGRSTPVDCPALQAYAGSTATDAYRRLAGACGDSLNHTFRRADGSFVHASDLFGTANVARDVGRVIGVLHLGRSTCTATRTGPTSRRPSRRGTRSCCAR
jgi:hypothetical protein